MSIANLFGLRASPSTDLVNSMTRRTPAAITDILLIVRLVANCSFNLTTLKYELPTFLYVIIIYVTRWPKMLVLDCVNTHPRKEATRPLDLVSNFIHAFLEYIPNKN